MADSIPHNTHNVILGMIGTLVVLFFIHRRQREDEREKRLQYWREQVKKIFSFLSHRRAPRLTHFHACRTLSAKTSSKCTKQPRLLYSSIQAHPAVRLYLASQRRTLKPQCCSMVGTQPPVCVNTLVRTGHTMVRTKNSWLCVPPICMTTRSERGGSFLSDSLPRY